MVVEVEEVVVVVIVDVDVMVVEAAAVVVAEAFGAGADAGVGVGLTLKKVNCEVLGARKILALTTSVSPLRIGGAGAKVWAANGGKGWLWVCWHTAHENFCACFRAESREPF